jgi:hypothetical protein
MDAKRNSGLHAVFSASNNEWNDERVKEFEAHIVTKRLNEENKPSGQKLLMQKVQQKGDYPVDVSNSKLKENNKKNNEEN